MTDQAWARFERSGSIADYLKYREDHSGNISSQTDMVSETRMDVKKVKEIWDTGGNYRDIEKTKMEKYH